MASRLLNSIYETFIKTAFRLAEFRLYYVYLSVLACFLTWLNWENQMMGGIVWYYEDFADFINSGFSDTYDFKSGTPGFPMWGYGFVLFLLKSRTVVIVLQQAFNLLSVYLIEDLLRKLGFNSKQLKAYRVFMFFAFCWYLFHTGFWPYSFATLFLIFSLLLLCLGITKGALKHYIVSAILYGLVLNLRSDYLYYFVFLIPSMVIWVYLKRKEHLLNIVVWIILICLILVPWGIHTQKHTGKAVMYSSNGGHHLFISLGQLPNNVWGITADDSDPLMRKIVDEALGPQERTVGHKADSVLRKAWKTRVMEEPIEYVKKCLFNIYSLFTRPFTHGEVYRKFHQEEDRIIELKRALKEDIHDFALIALTKKLFKKEYFGFMISVGLNISSIVLFMILLYSFFKGIFLFRLELFNDLILFISYSIIAYQITLQTLVYYLPNYHTNVLLFYIIIATMVIYNDKTVKTNNKAPA